MNSSKITIRPIQYIDINKVRRFFSEVDVPVNTFFSIENSLKLKNFPVKVLNSILPISWKFMTESYVALQDKQLVGLIGITPDSKSKLRWKINQLLLKPNGYDVGRLLIEFLVNKYGATGVETFIVEVDSNNLDALGLFKHACGFRECTINHIFQYSISEELPPETVIPHFREISFGDDAKLNELYQECLTPLVRTSLDKNASDFHYGLINLITENITGIRSKRWILAHPETKAAIASLNTITRDSRNFQVTMFTALPYAEYYEDLLSFIIRFIGLKNKEAHLSINVYESIQSYKKLLEILKEKGITSEYTCHVLVKDYWRPLKERKILEAPIIIFPESTSPACNSLHYNK